MGRSRDDVEVLDAALRAAHGALSYLMGRHADTVRNPSAATVVQARHLHAAAEQVLVEAERAYERAFGQGLLRDPVRPVRQSLEPQRRGLDGPPAPPGSRASRSGGLRPAPPRIEGP